MNYITYNSKLNRGSLIAPSKKSNGKEVRKMKWVEKRKLKEKKALETFIKEMEELGWVKRPDTKERFVTHYIEFVKDDKWIVIEWNEFITFGNNLTINGYVLMVITKYLKAVKL